MVMDSSKKIRKAHVPKFASGRSLAKTTAEDSIREQRVPTVIASGSVTHDPLIVPEPVLDSCPGLSSYDIRAIQLGLRQRKVVCSFDETALKIKSLRNESTISSTKRKLPKLATKLRMKVSASYEDVQRLLTKCSSYNPPPPTYVRPCKNTVDWDYFILNPDHLRIVPPVEFFHRAPLEDVWSSVAKVGLSIELRNPFAKGGKDVFWLGTIIYFAGYKALVKFESFEDSATECKNYLSWITFCSDVPRHLGWCAENGMELHPGPVVGKEITSDQLKLHVNEFMRRPTISRNHVEELYRAIRLGRKIDHSLPVEVMDKDSLTEYRLGRITAIVGNRVYVAYYKDASKEEEKFHDHGHRGHWYSYNSDLIHPPGWAHTIGVHLYGIDGSIRLPKLPREALPQYPEDLIQIQVGMFLETRHPIRLSRIVGAEVVETFKYGYFMIETRETKKDTRIKFIYHITSPFVLPLGFGAKHGVDVDFEASDGICPDKALNVDLLPPKPGNQFKVGDKVEAIDVLDGRYCAPATVVKVAGHLLLFSFDGWRKDCDENYHWVDVETSDIYPCGYREMMGIEWHGCLESPNDACEGYASPLV